ncbi:MAG: hemerythrin domain-containing protein [Burkholderiales bacterium]|jgi:hemerythrin-like domain-containing protein|nr:hemerythrin domain-containing protein [Burkholderiales bacterium]
MATSAKTQIIDMLKADHKKVKKAFKDFEKMDPQAESESAEALVEQTLAAIEVHSSLEEQIFYPAARSAIKEEDLIDEAEVEHMTVKVLIEQLKSMSASDDKFAATFKVLGEYIDHHVKEEENEMFVQLTRPGVGWDAVLEQMQTQRAQLLEEKGLPPEAEEATTPAGRSSAGSRASRSTDESRPQAASRSSKRSSASEKK